MRIEYDNDLRGPLYRQQKLRDVLQEREGKSLNYFEVFFSLYWIIFLVYLVLSQLIWVYFGLSWLISVHLGTYPTIWDYLWISWTISDYLIQSQTVFVMLCLSWFISDWFGLSRTILDYIGHLGLSGTILDYLRLSGTS